MSELNPMAHLSFDRIQTTSFWEKIKDTFNTFCRLFCRGGQTKAKLGLLEYCSFGFFYLVMELLLHVGLEAQELEERLENKKFISCYEMISHALKGLFVLPFWLLYLFLGAILTIISMPLVGIVHLLTKPTAPGCVPIWKSFLANPATWITFALCLLGVAFLLQGVVDPECFAQLVIPLSIIIPVLISIGVMSIFYAVCASTDQKSPKNQITVYFKEYRKWMSDNKLIAGVIWGLGIIALGFAIGITIDYFTGGLLSSTLAPLFDFMSQGFLTSFYSLATLPGLGFFDFISAEALATTSQVLSAITLISFPVFAAYSFSRFVETTMLIEYVGRYDILNKNIDNEEGDYTIENTQYSARRYREDYDYQRENDDEYLDGQVNPLACQIQNHERHIIRLGPEKKEFIMRNGNLFHAIFYGNKTEEVEETWKVGSSAEKNIFN